MFSHPHLRRFFRQAALISPLLLLAQPAHAQLGGLLDSVKDRVEREVERQVTGREDPQSSRRGQDRSSSGQSLQINEASDFIPGATTLVSTSFANAPKGAMPPEFKTNGSGSIVTVAGKPGRWLALQPFATYRLTDENPLPQRFTIEFDMLIAADTARDAGGFYFGFGRTNSARKYMMDAHNNGALAAVNMNFAGSGSVSSSPTDYYHSLPLDLRKYANQIMHISIAVDGDMMRVYLDQEKIADAQLFDDNNIKYFFFSAPTRTRNGAKLLFSNFTLAE
ncbi:hypothetical protein [Altericroceibacterium endophyticum]|uniref:Uncharacterized protein n=1 Tax=Altericroceibacterium endophyticum TaxID=1808508 RepID=A0A6I4TBA1_9SPHN|nr:hypothetical protein [Altericroceibacterium endophyticum]MXO67150.1 hypothetical protein [Altericroceibacterium endophyticum]